MSGLLGGLTGSQNGGGPLGGLGGITGGLTGQANGAAQGSASGALTTSGGQQQNGGDAGQKQIQQYQGHGEVWKDGYDGNKNRKERKKRSRIEQKEQIKKGGRLDTIFKRNIAAAHEMDPLFWRALCDDDIDDLMEYVADDCRFMNDLLSDEPMSKSEFKKALEDDDFEPPRAYQISSDAKAVQVGLMAVTTVYKVTIFENDGSETHAAVSSAWRQTAGADWVLCSQLIAYTR